MFDDRALILDESRWPGELLCLKKANRKGFGDSQDFGIITTSRFPVDVWTHEGAFIKQYASVDELLADDWIVD